MALFDQAGKAAGKDAVDELTEKTVPAILAGIEQDVKLATDTVKEVAASITGTAIPAIADGISQVLANINRLDGAEIEIGPIVIPAFTIKLKMPLKA